MIAGLGNIYVCEALFRAGISPKRLAAKVRADQIALLVPAIKAVLREAIKAGGSSLRDHKQTDGELGMFQHNFKVYGREGEPCPPSSNEGPTKKMQRHDQAHRAGGALHVLLPRLPEIGSLTPPAWDGCSAEACRSPAAI